MSTRPWAPKQLIAVLLLFGLFGRTSPLGAKPRATAPVVVTVVVDQLAAWVAAERWPLLPRSGGFARLRREGTYVRELRYVHATCDTAPGHAALYTGAVPRVSGIAANEVPPLAACHEAPLELPLRDRDAIYLDDKARLVTGQGPTARCGVSLRALRVDTLGDALRAAHPDAVIVSLSLKDRAALPGGGRKPTASVWFDVKAAGLVTATPFAQELPRWAEDTNRWLADTLAAGYWWNLEDPAWVAAHAATADAAAGEGQHYGADPGRGYPGLGRTFPHRVATAKALRATPLGDALLFRAALAALDGEGAGRKPTLLALSLSSLDAVGHIYGPDSWEAWDMLHQLDTAFGAFLRALDRRFGARGYAVLLSGDHGVIHMPEAYGQAAVKGWEKPAAAGRRLMPEPPPKDAIEGPTEVDLVTAMGTVAAGLPGGRREWITGIVDPYVYLSDEARTPPNRTRLLTALQTTSFPGVRRIVDAQALVPCPPPGDEGEDALLCRALVPSWGGDFYVLAERGSFFDTGYARGAGSSHGSPYLYDRAVPLVIRAPGRVAGRHLRREPALFAAFTQTAATLLGITAPAAALPAPVLVKSTQR